MNLASVDPKFLPLLNAVLDEVHLARGAARVGLPLPAAASALERCRQLLGDALLEDGGQAMQLTPAAQALREPLRLLLANEPAMEHPDTNRAARRVRLLMADYPAHVVAQPLYEALAAEMPGLSIEFLPWQGDAAAAASLERGEADLALAAPPRAQAALRSREVLQERCVAVMRPGHPAARQLTLSRWLDYPHLLVSSHDSLNRMLAEQLAAQGLARRVGMVVPSFLMAPALLHGSDLIAVMPMHCVPAASAAHPAELACLRPPLPLDTPPLHLLQHRRDDGDAALAVAAQALERIVKGRLAGR